MRLIINQKHFKAMGKDDFLNYDDEDQAIIDMMFGNCDSEDEIQEAIGDMMNSLG